MDVKKSVCPNCGTRTMVRIRLPNGRYTLKCDVCGLERGEFKPDTHRGVV
jgi:transcription elongation factor Elf1